MALSFNSILTKVNIPTEEAQTGGVGPTAVLDQDPYSVEQMRYPLDGIGQVDVPHHVVFYINVPQSSKYITEKQGSTVAGANSASTQNYDTLQSQGGTYQPLLDPQNPNGHSIGAGVGIGAFQTALTSGIANVPKDVVVGAGSAAALEALDLRPKLTRITKSIALYMPDTVATTSSHNWDGLSATAAGGDIARNAQIGGGSFGSAMNTISEATGVLKNLVPGGKRQVFNHASSAELVGGIAESGGQVGQGFTDLSLKSVNRAVNPHIEMTFSRTNNREYLFVFDLVPRSQKEALSIYNIIQTFKAFAAPEVTSESGGRYFIPPAQFDIKFYFMNVENEAIAKISTCVLTNITTNYVQQGAFSSFDDGMPQHINISLSFTEADIITRELVTQFGY